MADKRVKPKPQVAYKEFQYLRLNLPKVPGLYKLRRVYWLLNNYHKLLEKDPTAISSKQYIELLNTYCDLIEDAKKRGWDSIEGRKNARAGVDTKKLASGSDKNDPAGMGAPLPFGVGAGIPANDIVTGSGRNRA